jgi:hypothetical protein
MRLLSHTHTVQTSESLPLLAQAQFCLVYGFGKKLNAPVAGLSVHGAGNAVLAAVGEALARIP